MSFPVVLCPLAATLRTGVSIFALLLVAASASAQLGEQFKDRRVGYSVSPPEKWPKVPTEPREEYAVAKWAGKRDFGNFATEFKILAFSKVQPKKPAPEPDVPDEFEELLKGYGGFDLFKKAGNYTAYLRQQVGDVKFELPKPTREIVVRGFEAKVRLYDIYRDGGRDLANRPARFWTCAAVYDLPDRQFVLEFEGGEPSRDKLLPLYIDCARSFRLLAAKEIEAAEDEEALANMTEGQRQRRTAEITAKTTPGWWFKESEHYVILTNLPPNKADMIDEIMSRLKKVRRIYEKDFPPLKKIEAVSIVRVCKSREEYMNYGAPPGSAGYWNSHQKELVMYTEGQKDFVLSVLNHEAFHQYIHYCFGELSPHSWYNEGYGDYYAGATFDGSTAAIRPFKWRVGIIKDAIRQKKHVPLKKIVSYSQGEYYSNANLCYAEGWSIIYFLMKGLPKGHPYSRILPAYFKTLMETKDVDKAVKVAFDGIDFERLEEDWAAFITRDLKPSVPKTS